ncbi:hypothetical protein OG900_20895 [Streptomyces sp. NBC_00433]
MDAITFVSAVLALTSAAATAFLGYWTQRRLRTMEKRSLMETYGGSLAWAAYDLQARLFNILRGHTVDLDPNRGSGYLTSFLTNGTAGEAEFARRSTVFVLAEYLGWVEIMRRDVQFLNLGTSRTNHSIMSKISEVSSALNNISQGSNALRLFRVEQRAIGEMMIHPDGGPGQRRCLGFAEFSSRLDTDDQFLDWFRRLLSDVDLLAANTGAAVSRLAEVQQNLISLIDLLDPRSERFPHSRMAFVADHPNSS